MVFAADAAQSSTADAKPKKQQKLKRKPTRAKCLMAADTQPHPS